MIATYLHGDQLRLDYTPSADVAAGSVVIVGDFVCIANLDIKANELGALSVSGVYKVPKNTGGGSAVSAGQKLYYDVANSVFTKTVGSNELAGHVAPSGAAADADTHTILVLGRSVGNQVFVGAADPTTQGSDGDVFFQTASGKIHVKAAGAWNAGTVFGA